MAEIPGWYRLIRAAKYLGVAPWELLERPDSWAWQEAAFIAEVGENEAQEIVNKRAAKG